MRIEYVNPEINRSEWKSPREAKGEPDKVQWIDAATGLDCLINRGPSGALCDYVGVPKSHPLHGKGYDGVDVDVHGGLTFSDGCSHSDKPYKGICHVPQNGRPDDVWWFGFDCAHSGDFCPSYDDPERMSWSGYPNVYRDIRYVEREVSKLAAQLAGHSNADAPSELKSGSNG